MKICFKYIAPQDSCFQVYIKMQYQLILARHKVFTLRCPFSRFFLGCNVFFERYLVRVVSFTWYEDNFWSYHFDSFEVTFLNYLYLAEPRRFSISLLVSHWTMRIIAWRVFWGMYGIEAVFALISSQYFEDLSRSFWKISQSWKPNSNRQNYIRNSVGKFRNSLCDFIKSTSRIPAPAVKYIWAIFHFIAFDLGWNIRRPLMKTFLAQNHSSSVEIRSVVAFKSTLGGLVPEPCRLRRFRGCYVFGIFFVGCSWVFHSEVLETDFSRLEVSIRKSLLRLISFNFDFRTLWNLSVTV